MTDKSKTLCFQAARLTACSLLLAAWLPLTYAGSGHDHDSDSGHDHGAHNHDHGHDHAPATEAFYPDEENTAKTAPQKAKEDAHEDEHHHDHHGNGNDHHQH